MKSNTTFIIVFLLGVLVGSSSQEPVDIKEIKEDNRSDILLDDPKVDYKNLWILPIEMEKDVEWQEV